MATSQRNSVVGVTSFRFNHALEADRCRLHTVIEVGRPTSLRLAVQPVIGPIRHTYRIASSRPEAYQLANDRSGRKAVVRVMLDMELRSGFPFIQEADRAFSQNVCLTEKNCVPSGSGATSHLGRSGIHNQRQSPRTKDMSNSTGSRCKIAAKTSYFQKMRQTACNRVQQFRIRPEGP
jgi:hypothetical protein